MIKVFAIDFFKGTFTKSKRSFSTISNHVLVMCFVVAVVSGGRGKMRPFNRKPMFFLYVIDFLFLATYVIHSNEREINIVLIFPSFSSVFDEHETLNRIT